MKERPILFSGPMVRAILEGRKTQTRRPLKSQPTLACSLTDGILPPTPPGAAAVCQHYVKGEWAFSWPDLQRLCLVVKCPYGVPGDRLWVRETWGIGRLAGRLIDPCLNYRADGALLPLVGNCSPDTWSIVGSQHEVNGTDLLKVREGWIPAIHMPRWASRITLEITDVRVERVQEISEKDAEAEGVTLDCPVGHIQSYQKSPYVYSFAQLWDSINAKRGHGWDTNPWVWALSFNKAVRT